MDIEPTSAPATKADIAMVLAELRAFRVWVEGKFELIDQRLKELERRVGALEKGYERLTAAMGWRLTVLNVTLVAAIIGAGLLS